jgi:hypothetical protein
MPKGIYPRTLKPPAERFWPKVQKTKTCWLWTGAKDGRGYGTLQRGRRGEGQVKAHVLAYELLVGPVPEGLELDHVKANGCISKRCVKAVADEFGPAHLEPVTRRENQLRGDGMGSRNARKTHCPQGHPYDEANTYHYRARRQCRICRAASQIEWWKAHAR